MPREAHHMHHSCYACRPLTTTGSPTGSDGQTPQQELRFSRDYSHETQASGVPDSGRTNRGPNHIWRQCPFRNGWNGEVRPFLQSFWLCSCSYGHRDETDVSTYVSGQRIRYETWRCNCRGINSKPVGHNRSAIGPCQGWLNSSDLQLPTYYHYECKYTSPSPWFPPLSAAFLPWASLVSSPITSPALQTFDISFNQDGSQIQAKTVKKQGWLDEHQKSHMRPGGLLLDPIARAVVMKRRLQT